MKHEPTDAHPCGSCLRWPECNGVEWPRCGPGVEYQTERVNSGIVSVEEARAMLGLALDRKESGLLEDDL